MNTNGEIFTFPDETLAREFYNEKRRLKFAVSEPSKGTERFVQGSWVIDNNWYVTVLWHR